LDDDFFKSIESHLETDQFRRRVMLFQRCDNILRPLFDNLEEIRPRTDEELAIYTAFLQAARIILAEMKLFLPENTFKTLNGRLDKYETIMHRDMRQDSTAD